MIFSSNTIPEAQIFGSIFSSPDNENGSKPQLDIPTIMVEQSEDNEKLLYISSTAVVGASSYRLVINGVVVAVSATNEIEYELGSGGVYEIYVRCYGVGYKPSKPSNIEIIKISKGIFLFTGLRYLWTGLRKIIGKGA